MTAQKHTPGPWFQDPDDMMSIRAPDADLEPWRIASVEHGAGYGPWDHESEANARLIAAAPEMLEALKAFEAHYPMGINPTLDEAWRSARAAIAKATGQ